MKEYIAITLGPITRIIDLAESTKEVWAASYFFSYLAKNIIKPFKEKNRLFLLPLVDNEEMWKPHKGAGLFPDRYIFEAFPGDFDLLKDIIYGNNGILKKIAETISNLLHRERKQDEIYSYLKSTLKIFFFQKAFDEKAIKKNIVAKCEHLMALLEMQDTFPSKEKENYLHSLFVHVNGDPIWDKKYEKVLGFTGSFLTQDAYGENAPKDRLFESVVEISAAELHMNAEKYYNLDPENIILENSFVKPYHKYIAIVKADGDSIGKTIEQIQDTMDLSKALLEFGVEATEIITRFRGKPVFIGGDDLLFFSPICYEGKTIFDLIQELDSCFFKCLEKHIDSSVPFPTLSYGVSITYYKYPMFEALENADYLLEQLAKEKEWKRKLLTNGFNDSIIRKNNIAFSMQKHSGQMISSLIRKEYKESYKLFENLIHTYIKRNNNPDKSNEATSEQFLASVMHTLKKMEPMFRIILNQEINGGQNEEVNHRKPGLFLSNFLDNNFNEKVHEQYKGLLDNVKELLLVSYQEGINKFMEHNAIAASRKKNQSTARIAEVEEESVSVDIAREAMNQVYAALRFIHFINKKK